MDTKRKREPERLHLDRLDYPMTPAEIGCAVAISLGVVIVAAGIVIFTALLIVGAIGAIPL